MQRGFVCVGFFFLIMSLTTNAMQQGDIECASLKQENKHHCGLSYTVTKGNISFPCTECSMQMRRMYIGLLNMSAAVCASCTNGVTSLRYEALFLFMCEREHARVLFVALCGYKRHNEGLSRCTVPLCRCDISLQGAPRPLRSDLHRCQEGVSGELGGHGNARATAGHVCRRIRQLWCWLAVRPDSTVRFSRGVNAR